MRLKKAASPTNKISVGLHSKLMVLGRSRFDSRVVQTMRLCRFATVQVKDMRYLFRDLTSIYFCIKNAKEVAGLY